MDMIPRNNNGRVYYPYGQTRESELGAAANNVSDNPTGDATATNRGEAKGSGSGVAVSSPNIFPLVGMVVAVILFVGLVKVLEVE
jgi:hypothetical protein